MTSEEYWIKNKTKLQLNERSYNAFEMGVKFCENNIADIKANCDLAIEGRDIKIKELEEENNKLLDVINNYEVKVADLEDAEIINKAFKQQIKVLEKEKAEIKDNLEDLQEQNTHMFNVIALQEQQIEQMKCDVKQGQSYWNSGEMQYRLYQKLLDKWEIKENETYTRRNKE